MPIFLNDRELLCVSFVKWSCYCQDFVVNKQHPYSNRVIKRSQETLLQDYSITFTDWIKERPELITMATEVKTLKLKSIAKWKTPLKGKDKLEWSRTVDSSKLETLKALMADPNYKDNLNVIIRWWHKCYIGCWRSMTSFLSRTIYDFAYMTYADLPRGAVAIFTDLHNCHTSYVCFCLQIKNNSMKKLAANTLMEILPEEMQNMVKLILIDYQFIFGFENCFI